jgi:hypothetical protein
MIRTTVMLTRVQVAGLAERSKADEACLKPSHLIRTAISEFLARRKRQMRENQK